MTRGSIAKLKRHVVEHLLEDEDFFLIVVDTRYPGVVMPPHLLATKQPVGINIGLRMALPIPDLELDEAGVRGTLSFSRSPFHCTFPWAALLQISVDDEHLVWVLPQPEEGDRAGEGEQADPSRPQLRLV